MIAIVTAMPLPNVSDPSTGGLGTHVSLLTSQMKRRGIQSTLLETSSVRGWRRRVLVGFQSVVGIRPAREVWLKSIISYLSAEISALAPDLVHAHDALAAVAANKAGYRPLLTVHGPLTEHAKETRQGNSKYHRFLQNIEHQGYGDAAEIIAVDSGQKALLVKKGVSSNKITVIFNSVDVIGLQNLYRRVNVKRHDGGYFIVARRLVPKNGVEYAIRAFLNWVGDKNICLYVAGDGTQRRELERLCLMHQNGSKVVFKGSMSQSELFPVMAGAIGSIVPSVPFEGVIEATSLTALESLALGLPTIASNIGGLAEIQLETGLLWLAPPGDVSAICDWFEHALNESQEARVARMDAAARVISIESWFSKLEALYRRHGE
jgi:glycosyltransferase involved in cell wall biosynthesis